jgi:pimeloyl-ACP methyl ester carboxylesterase
VRPGRVAARVDTRGRTDSAGVSPLLGRLTAHIRAGNRQPSSGFTVVVYDQRGWGAARDLPGPYGISQLADDVLDVIRELGIGRYVLVGHSMGGKVAQLAASRNLEGLGGVVLIAPAPPRPTVDTDAAQRRSHAYDSRASISDALERVLTYRPLAAGLREQVITDSLAGNLDALLAWPLHGITQNITEPAGLIGVPVHLVAGRYDLVDPPASLEANLLPVIPGAPMTVSTVPATCHRSKCPTRLQTRSTSSSPS